MSEVPPRLQPLLAPGSPGAEGRGCAHRRRPPVLPGRRHRSGTRWSAPCATARSTTSPPTPDPTRSRRCCGRSAGASSSSGHGSGPSAAIVDDVPCEVTTFRSDVYHPESRKPEVEFGDDIETDLSRRDFSVNAMALRLPEPELIDPYGGALDLFEQAAPHAASRRRCRSPTTRCGCCARRASSPASGSRPCPSWSTRCASTASGLEIVSAERIRDELSKLLVVDDPGPGLWFLSSTGLSDEFLPELNAMQLEQDPIHHHKDVLAHTIAVAQKVSPDLGAAARCAAPRRRQAEDAVVRAGPRVVPPPRGRGRAHGRASGSPRCATRRTSSRRSPSSSTCTCASTPTRWAGPTPRCAGTCATRGRCSTS